MDSEERSRQAEVERTAREQEIDARIVRALQTLADAAAANGEHAIMMAAMTAAHKLEGE